MEDILPMDGCNCVRESDGNRQDLSNRQSSARNDLSQSFSFNELHGEKRNVARQFHRMNGHDVRMVQGGDGLRFPLEAMTSFWVAHHGRRENLQSDAPLQFQIFRGIDLAHAAAA